MSFKPTLAGAIVGLVVLATTTSGEARNAGIAAEGCEGCHTGGKLPTITLDISPSAPKPGDAVTITVNIPSVNGGTGGIYLRSNGKGTLSTVAGQPTRLIDIGNMVHSSPKAPSGGVVQFIARWTAPVTPGGATISVWGVAANSDSSRGGDGASSATKSFAVGCDGKTYYRDWDGDGFGTAAESVVDCSKPAGYVENKDDCDDNDNKAFPGAPEICNMRDDNCNGQIDENLVEATHYEDKDGDGYGTVSGKTVFAKCPPPGYAPRVGDCDENDPKVHPGVIEICNHRDDNCDGRVDERVRPICGVGMCARAAPTCEPDTCEPGLPKPEKCNGLDDDCDGEVDEGEGLCPAGQVCHETECKPAESVPPPTADGGVDAPSAASDSGGCTIANGSSGSWLILAGLLVVGRRRHARTRAIAKPS
jgi:hypothetical protein